LKHTSCEECKHRFDVIQKESEFIVDIEPGMNDKEAVTFYGEGDASTSTKAGDLIFVVFAQPHKTFVRKGNDLRTKMTIPLKDALTGFKTTIKHLDGRDVEVEVNQVVKPGMEKKLRAKGMPIRNRPREFGDLYIEFDVEFPSTLTDAQKEALRKAL